MQSIKKESLILNKLKELNLAGTKVTDAGLVHLKELTNLELERLFLSSTRVTDADSST